MANYFGSNEAGPETSWQIFLGTMKAAVALMGNIFGNNEAGP